MVSQAGEPRWWRRGRDAAQARARAASAEAAVEFVELDALQRRVGLQVDAYTALERDGDGDRLAQAWAEQNRRTDEAATAYLRMGERFDVAADLAESVARQAESAYRHVGEQLRAARAAVEEFAAQSATRFARATGALDRLAAAGRDADAAIGAARAAIERAQAAGMPAHEAAEVLARAERSRKVLMEGAAVHGLRAAMAAADTVLADAARARELAESLPRQRDEVRRSLTAVRTRLDALEHRLDGLPAVLSTLRRRFVASSFADVEARPAAARQRIATARERLAAAERSAAEQHWPRARAAVADTRAALDAARADVDAVTSRLALLEEFERDREGPVRQARFTVREAQRLFVYLGERAQPYFAGQLDALSRRIDAVQRALAAPRPDFWRLRTELDRIRDEANGVVRRLRGG